MTTLADLYVQRQRVKGWRKPEGSIICCRPSRWGNPFKVVKESGIHYVDGPNGESLGSAGPDPWSDPVYIVTGWAVEWYAHMIKTGGGDGTISLGGRTADLTGVWVPTVDQIRTELGGKTLGCACPPRTPCHVQDVLLPIANPHLIGAK